MVSLAVEVHDLANVHNLLVVPSPRRVPTAKEMAAFVARLAPIEMAAPSISSNTKQQAPLSSKAGSCEEPHHKQQALQGWAIPLGYAGCGLLLFLCSVLVPDGLVPCAHILTPVWTLALAAHALALNDPVWAWSGLLVACLLPFVLLLRNALFFGFYLLVFAAFGSGGRFWQALKGPPFILACVCWLGLLVSLCLAVLADHARAQLTVATFFALASAVVTSGARFGRLVVLRAG
jgi:hypothetical protein